MPRYGAIDPSTVTPRINGFSPPMTQNQILFIVGNFGSFLAFYVSASIFILSNEPLKDEEQLFSFLIFCHAIIACIGFFSWMFVETHDPSIPSCFGNCLPNTRKWTVPRFVSEHRKPIEGLDHFCQWLNVAIARSNYIPFFMLTSCGFIQYILQGIISFLMISLWHKDLVAQVATPEDPDALVITMLLFIVCLTSLAIALPYSMLLFFHFTLITSGETTYTYVQNVQRAELKRKKEITANQNKNNKNKNNVLPPSESSALNVDLDTELGLLPPESPPPGGLEVNAEDFHHWTNNDDDDGEEKEKGVM